LTSSPRSPRRADSSERTHPECRRIFSPRPLQGFLLQDDAGRLPIGHICRALRDTDLERPLEVPAGVAPTECARGVPKPASLSRYRRAGRRHAYCATGCTEDVGDATRAASDTHLNKIRSTTRLAPMRRVTSAAVPRGPDLSRRRWQPAASGQGFRWRGPMIDETAVATDSPAAWERSLPGNPRQPSGGATGAAGSRWTPHASAARHGHTSTALNPDWDHAFSNCGLQPTLRGRCLVRTAGNEQEDGSRGRTKSRTWRLRIRGPSAHATYENAPEQRSLPGQRPELTRRTSRFRRTAVDIS